MSRSRSRTLFARHALALLSLGISAALHAQNAPTQSDWGGAGLLQTPSARMADEGELSFTASHTSPYSRYNLSMQPLPWLEGSFRYISVANRRYGSEALSGDQNYKDKSIDLKVRLWRESRWLPEVAIGARDLGGTGLFSSEYLVANKRFGPIDASLGLATGYIGNRGDFSNPLGWIDDRFKTRPGSDTTGEFNTSSMFRGPVGVFGGIAYQTPWDRLLLKLEYDGNDYKNEPQNNNQKQDSPLNFGAVFTVNRNVQIHLGWERGNTLMAGITLHTNLAHTQRPPKLLDPAPEPLRTRAPATGLPPGSEPTATTPAVATAGVPQGNYRDAADKAHAERQQGIDALQDVDWADVAKRLHDNAGVSVQKISRRGSELIVSGEQGRFLYPAKGLGRSARILDNVADPSIDWFTVENVRLGMPISEASVNRDKFAAYVDHRTDLDDLVRGTELNPPSAQSRDVLYEAPFKRFSGGLGLGYRQNIGGPDAFILYQFALNYSANFYFTRDVWLSGTASYNFYNNYDKFTYDAPSNLPRVRTYLRQYLTTSDFTVPNFQLTATHKLGSDLYGMAYAGMLESMYGGVGGEVLYRPFGERWALGLDANWVKQRDFDQGTGFRDYQIATGQATLYYLWGDQHRVLTTLSAGRYLAGDWGATFNVVRMFDNGVTMGAYVTKTDVSSAEFGEGSFDKGIFVSIPFDFVLPRSTRSRATFLWQPLTRDGGARLARKYSLYQLTSERDGEFFFDNIDQIDK